MDCRAFARLEEIIVNGDADRAPQNVSCLIIAIKPNKNELLFVE
jgi:hypothetical protein